jgi:molybdopterin synthase sulfur carrier subunit
MTLRLRFFASLRERAGTSETTIEVEGPITVEALWQRLRRDVPGLAGYSGPLRFAVDQTYVDNQETLQDNAEVAFIPPVSGG